MLFASQTALAVAAALAIALVPVAAEAQCRSCKTPTKVVAGKTTHSSSVSRPKRTIVRYKNVRRTNYVDVVTRQVHVRRVVPITHVRIVTRVHEHTIYPCPKPKCAR